jgi:hypothetical protein
MNQLFIWLKEKGCPFPGIAVLAELAELCQETFNKVNILAGSIVGIEILLEHHGLLTPETMVVVREKMAERMKRVEPQPENQGQDFPIAADALLVRE